MSDEVLKALDPDTEMVEVEEPDPDDYTPQKFDLETQKQFLENFSEVGVIKKAVKGLDISVRTVYRAKNCSERFRNAFNLAKKVAVENLEEEMYRRAVEGVERPVFQKGERVGATKHYSDGLLKFLSKTWAPDKFDSNEEKGISGNVHIEINPPSEEDNERLIQGQVQGDD